MHTDAMLAILDNETTALGNQLRKFQSNTCSMYKTYELRREMEARQRRETKAHDNGKPGSSTPVGQRNAREHQPKILNLQTYKVHSLGDYVSTIRQFGTSDSYTTAIVSPLSITNIIERVF